MKAVNLFRYLELAFVSFLVSHEDYAMTNDCQSPYFDTENLFS